MISLKKAAFQAVGMLTAAAMLFGLTACSSMESIGRGETSASTDSESHMGSASSTTETTTSAGSVTDLAGIPVRSPQVSLKGNGEDTVTVLIYMNGSNLESEDGSATADLTEMVRAGSGDKVNVLVQTMGTKSWSRTYSIASDRSQIYSVTGNGLELVKDDLGQLDSTAEETLSDFIVWGAENYPADRYMLILWDHGGGPVYGFGYDEFQAEDAALTLDEMQSALRTAGVYFDFIGFDACIMSSLEVCCALYDYCDYMILSEDFEPGIGWYYTDWLKALYTDSSVSTTELGQKVVEGTVSANQSDPDGDECILALLNEGMMKVLYAAWVNFAYANEESLLGSNYSQHIENRGRYLPVVKADQGGYSDWLTDDDDEYSLADYYITDIMALASTIDSTEAAALSSALSQTVEYMDMTSGISGETGISVTLPYGDNSFYQSLKTIFTNCGFDSEYVNWLGNFVNASGESDYYDYGSFDQMWSGWDNYDDNYNWDDWDYYGDSDYWNDSDYWGWDDWYWSDWDDGYYGYGPGDHYDDYYDDGYYDDYNEPPHGAGPGYGGW